MKSNSCEAENSNYGSNTDATARLHTATRNIIYYNKIIIGDPRIGCACHVYTYTYLPARSVYFFSSLPYYHKCVLLKNSKLYENSIQIVVTYNRRVIAYVYVGAPWLYLIFVYLGIFQFFFFAHLTRVTIVTIFFNRIYGQNVPSKIMAQQFITIIYNEKGI